MVIGPNRLDPPNQRVALQYLSIFTLSGLMSVGILLAYPYEC